MQIEGFDGTTVTLAHEGYHYTLDLTTLTHPMRHGGTNAMVWTSPVLASTDGGLPQQVAWPIDGGPEAQRIAVYALVAQGVVPTLDLAVMQVTADLAASGVPVRLDTTRL